MCKIILLNYFSYKLKVSESQFCATTINNYDNKMKCTDNSECPPLYICSHELCQHQPLAEITPNLLVAIFLTPLLAALGNRMGLASTWLIYPISMLLMCYHYAESFSTIAPIAMSSSLISAILAITEKSQTNSGPAANYYIINTTIPVYVVGFHIGLKLSSFLPFGSTALLAVLLAITFTLLYIREYKEIRADEQIAVGHFRKLLPTRLQSPKKKNKSSKKIQIQMAQIPQADSEYEVGEKHEAPSRKAELRSQMLQGLKNHFPINHFILAFCCFAIYESLCLSLPPLFTYLGMSDNLWNVLTTYGILLLLAVAGEFYLYKFYVEPVKIQEQQIKLNLGLQLDGSKMVKICLLGFIGSLLEGYIGFGFCQIIGIYLIYNRMKVNAAIATCGFFSLFLGSILTLNRVFCDNFQGLQYLIVFSISLGLIILFQYILNACLLRNLSPERLASSLLILTIIMQLLCLAAVISATSLDWKYFGTQSLFSFGSISAC